MIVEYVFGISGLGSLAIQAALDRDYGVLESVVLLLASLSSSLRRSRWTLSAVSWIPGYIWPRRMASRVETLGAVPGEGRFWRSVEVVRSYVRAHVALVVAVCVLATLGVACLLAPVIAPYSPEAQNFAETFASPSAAHWFGTDELGRDLFSRFLYGGQISLLIAIGASAISIIIGSLWGFLAAIRGGWLDELLMRSADVLMGTPQMLLALVFVASFGPSEVGLIVIIGALLSPVHRSDGTGVSRSL